MSFKHLFSRTLEAAPGRLHFAAHSHHLWPDASFDGQVECWQDAARLADVKWDKVMDSVWPEAQTYVSDELGTGDASTVVFAANTHELLVRLVAACPRSNPSRLRVLTSDGEFHSARRQFARWQEDGWLEVETIASEPFEDFTERFLAAAGAGNHDLILVSHVLFGSGRLFDGVAQLATLASPQGPWTVIDGYHAFMAIHCPYPHGGGAFYVGGGYKYAMAGEGIGFMHCPPDFGPRPPITGWYAEFGELTAPPGGVGYRQDAMRFMGATFDPSALYRFNAIRRMLSREELTTARISAHAEELQQQALEALSATPLGGADLLNPLDGGPHARFLAFRSARAASWQKQLRERQCITDVRGDVLRIGFGLYQDSGDVSALAKIAADLD
ncbi:aminotransferase class V-fold PLP-dependent enzyme [Sphingomonas sp. HDW15A]|uniref:aminotransferase class V-fold PLP-dependent enzyme n=1 Tax=Sphingomonas sp. HDW15A TaxID=2714942 RepID=UPI0014087814|nr:aminotransferase class V-fold PLP-dependent enzyme [Sphingomonas sp. HDW15A]QIK97014.1 aminotransferase class V-fold PLP-dependent enzyme [Sphingomonas sp. HDW15A]